MHPTETGLQGLLDGELSTGSAEQMRHHLEGCEVCSSRMRDLEKGLTETGQLLELLDRSPPPVSADEIIEIAEKRHIPSRRARYNIPWAAAVAGLVVVVVASAAIPGSPVREILANLMDGLGSRGAPEVSAPAQPWAGEAGVALTPGGEIEIVFEAAQADGSIEVLLVESDTARIEVQGDSVGFAVGDRSIRVENRGATADYRITLPEDIPRAQIRIGNRSVFAKEGSRILRAEGMKGEQTYRVPFSSLKPEE